MPIPVALAGAALGAGASILGNVLSGSSNKKAAEKNREFAEYMYNKQRTDALSDWERENMYNSPKEQMARLRDANLNPNLVYGHGATAEGGSVRSSAAPSTQQQGTQYDLSGVGDSIGNYQDIKLREAQTDNLAAQNKVIQQDAILRAAQVQQTLSSAHTAQFDLKMKERLKEISAEMAAEGLNKLRSEAGTAANENKISSETINARIEKVWEEWKKIKGEANMSQHLEKRITQEIENLQREGDLKKFQINLNRLGINSSDPWYLRIITQLFGKYVPTN